MASTTTLEERFNLAVRTIQNLPADGIIRLSNLTKLIFYGLYKQATVGPCQQACPSMFNYVARAKWEAWDRYGTMTKEEAMSKYIDEIRKIVEKMPQTEEVIAFARSVGISKEPMNDSVAEVKTLEYPAADDDSPVIIDDSTTTVITAENDSVPSLSSTSSSSSSSISSSDIDEFYEDPLDFLSLEMASNSNCQQRSTETAGLQAATHVYNDQSGTLLPIRNPTRVENNRSNLLSTRPGSVRSSTGAQYSASSITSAGDDGHYPTNSYNRETQRAILTVLTTLQRDIHHILERLNRLEALANRLQQRELSTILALNSSSSWLPLSGFRRGAIAFILLWPFLAYVVIRLYLRSKIIIRFRR